MDWSSSVVVVVVVVVSVFWMVIGVDADAIGTVPDVEVVVDVTAAPPPIGAPRLKAAKGFEGFSPPLAPATPRSATGAVPLAGPGTDEAKSVSGSVAFSSGTDDGPEAVVADSAGAGTAAAATGELSGAEVSFSVPARVLSTAAVDSAGAV